MKQFVLFFLFLIPSFSWACTCNCSISTLCEALRSDDEYAVLHIRILDKSEVPDGWTLEVINDLNDSGVPDTIYYGIGGSCSEHIRKIDGTELEVGDEEIIVCEKYNYDATLNIQYYHAYSCAYVELDLIGDDVIGAINSTQDTMSYDSLRSYVSEGYQHDRYCSSCDCSCYYPNPFFLEFDSTFCRTLKLAMLKDPSALVSRLLVTEISGNRVTAEVIDVLRGRETRTEITLWTKFGNECRKGANDFMVGHEYVMILQKLRPQDITSPGEMLDDYYLSSCGNHVLPLENGTINAKVTHSISRMTYAELKREINKPGCHDWIVNNNDPAIHEIEVFPNPATDKVYINLNAAIPVDVLIYDITGQVLLARHFSNQSNILIDLMDLGLSSCTLLVEIQQKEQSVIKKLLVR